MEKLTALYEAILTSLGLEIGEGGLVSMPLAGEMVPLTCDGKRLIMPSQEYLRNPNWDAHVAFHPSSESITRGQSTVLKKTRSLVNLRLSHAVSLLATELMEIAANKDIHDKLNPTQTRFLKMVPEADAKTVKALESVIRASSVTGDNQLVNVYLNRGGKLDGVSYFRLGIVTFPIFEHFETEGHEIFGVKMRKKDKQAIAALFHYMLPDGDDRTTYSRGSNEKVAPFFNALMHAYVTVADQLNQIAKRFKPRLSSYKEIHTDTSWHESMGSLDKLSLLIPALDGNDGEVGGDEEQPAQTQSKAPTNTSAPAPAPVADNRPRTLSGSPPPPEANPFQPNMPGAVDNGADDDWQTFMQKRAIGMAPPTPTFPAVGGGGGMPQQNPSYPPQQQWGNQNGWPLQSGMGNPMQPQTPRFPAVGQSHSPGQQNGGGYPGGGTVSSV